jgi:hypothetical protein
LVHFTFRDFSFSEHNRRRRLSIRTPRLTFLSLLWCIFKLKAKFETLPV